MNKFIISLLLFSCSFINAEEVIPDYGARYVYKKWDCEIKGDGFKLRTKGKKIIYNKLGEDYNYVSCYESKYYKIKDISIRLIDKNGKEIYKCGKKDMTKACGYDKSSFYNDICTYYLELSAPQFPYTIEYEYEQECKSQFFWGGARFQHYIPVDTAIYTLTTPKNFGFESKIYGLDITSNESSDNKKDIYRWSMFDVPVLEDIDYIPPGGRERGRIKFAAHTIKLDKYILNELSWDGIGKWYNNLAYGEYQLKGVNNSLDKLDIVKETYNQIINDIRYVAIEIGIGGWKPYKPELTKSRGFGDCKDMSTLLISELNQKQISAQPVLVLTKSNGPLDTDFPNIGFNHVIAMTIVGNDTIWMDPTCNDCPFGELPRRDEDIDVMTVFVDGGKILRTPKSTAYDNREIRTTNYKINSKKYVNFTTEIKAFGNYALYLRRNLKNLDKDDEKQFIMDLIPGADKLYKIKDFYVKNLDDIYSPVIITINARGNKQIDKIGNKLYFNPFIFNKPNSLEKLDLTDREYPIRVYYPYLEQDIMTIEWDTLFSVDSIIVPDDDSLIFDFGSIKRSSEIKDNSIEINFEKAYHNYSIEIEQFPNFQLFCDKLKKFSSKHIKLIDIN